MTHNNGSHSLSVPYVGAIGTLDVRLDWVGLSLAGRALRWFNQHEHEWLSWSEFVADFLNKFELGVESSLARLSSISQGRNEPVEYYAETMRFLFAQVGSLTDKLTMSYFINGLQPYLRDSVILMRPRTFDEAVEHADYIEALGQTQQDQRACDGRAKVYNRSNNMQGHAPYHQYPFQGTRGPTMTQQSIDTLTDRLLNLEQLLQAAIDSTHDGERPSAYTPLHCMQHTAVNPARPCEGYADHKPIDHVNQCYQEMGPGLQRAMEPTVYMEELDAHRVAYTPTLVSDECEYGCTMGRDTFSRGHAQAHGSDPAEVSSDSEGYQHSIGMRSQRDYLPGICTYDGAPQPYSPEPA